MNLFDLSGHKSTSSNYAKDRLKLLLVSDRANCSPNIIEQIKNDMIMVISRYMELDEAGLEIQIMQNEAESSSKCIHTIYANIPIKDLTTKTIK